EHGRLDEAFQTAQEATNLYRELVRAHFRTFSSRFANALETYKNILERSGNAKEAARIRQERNAVLKRIEEMEERDA
ncbi:hypothetical protein, partial [Actinomyces oris]|uniref:hypothetical protein n=1 Tax=Actinomyces oris TaxID=544580 RepID=UPI0037BFA292